MADRILILGGGFAGLATARTLERTLAPGEAEITLVSRENFTLFTPMLPEIGSGTLETRHVVTPVRAQLRRTSFVLADVKAIDFEARSVHVEHTIAGAKQTLSYDQLVIALGSVTSTFGLPGIAEHYPDPRAALACDTAHVDLHYVISRAACHGVRYFGVASVEVAVVRGRPAAATTEPIACRR